MAWLLNDIRAGWTPAVTVKVDGSEVAAGFYGRLVELTTIDETEQGTDNCTFVLDDARNELSIPREKARIEVSLGYRETGIFPVGEYELQSVNIRGGDDGELLVIQGEAADLRRSLRGSSRRSWENATLGQIVRDIARDNNREPVVASELEGITIPYVLKTEQSDIDFLTRLGDEHGAVVKPMGRRLVVVQRAAGISASGQALPPFEFDRSDCKNWNVEPYARATYSRVSAGWIDPRTGRRRTEEYGTGLDGPELILPEAQPSQEQARREARAEGRRLTSDTGAGFFEMYGRPDAQSGAITRPSGFRAEASGPWLIGRVQQKISDSGFMTRIDVKSPPVAAPKAKTKAQAQGQGQKSSAATKPQSQSTGQTGRGIDEYLWWSD